MITDGRVSPQHIVQLRKIVQQAPPEVLVVVRNWVCQSISKFAKQREQAFLTAGLEADTPSPSSKPQVEKMRRAPAAARRPRAHPALRGRPTSAQEGRMRACWAGLGR